MRDEGPCGKGQDDTAVGNGIDGGCGGGGGRVGVPEGRVMRQGGTGHKTITCATKTDDKPIRGGGRDPSSSKSLV